MYQHDLAEVEILDVLATDTPDSVGLLDEDELTVTYHLSKLVEID